ncbi:LacI family DNA-binding transcriptional regulator [Amycolatopsis sp. lyj-23]|uniref:LacI family DNA-binding transcriptional regulator n=1 Tax=Amycolatopsis sp. lyj-23 TaxID=2789283 RepID=UPI00397A60E8
MPRNEKSMNPRRRGQTASSTGHTRRYYVSTPCAREPGAEPRAAGMKEVAAAAGVSLGTVSNVLNRPGPGDPRPGRGRDGRTPVRAQRTRRRGGGGVSAGQVRDRQLGALRALAAAGLGRTTWST